MIQQISVHFAIIDGIKAARRSAPRGSDAVMSLVYAMSANGRVDSFYIIHVGDSRIYGENNIQLTTDDSPPAVDRDGSALGPLARKVWSRRSEVTRGAFDVDVYGSPVYTSKKCVANIRGPTNLCLVTDGYSDQFLENPFPGSGKVDIVENGLLVPGSRPDKMLGRARARMAQGIEDRTGGTQLSKEDDVTVMKVVFNPVPGVS